MAAGCLAGQYWDALIKKCMHCHMECQRAHVIPRCTSYCVSATCKALAGHYYDGLLRKCVRCSDVCGRHPAECSQHCQTPPPPVPAGNHPGDVTSRVLDSRPSASLDASTVVLYPLLAVCLVLLFFSLSLASAVFLRGARARTSNPRPKEAKHDQECAVQHGHQAAWWGRQQEQISKDFGSQSSRPADCEPSDASSPTETCVCVHCFPELKALRLDHSRPTRAPFPSYPQAALHRAQQGGPLWTDGNTHTSGWEAQEESAVG